MPKDKVFGRDVPETCQGPRRRDILEGAFFSVLDREWPGCPAIGSGRPFSLGFLFGKTLCLCALMVKRKPPFLANFSRFLADFSRF